MQSRFLLHGAVDYAKEKARGFRLRKPRAFYCLRSALTSQVLLIGFDHLFDHLAADRARLTGGQIAIVALLQVDTNLPWCTSAILKPLDK